MKTRQARTFVGDFETTVYDGQTSTEVWAAALVEMYTEDCQIFHSIDEFFEHLESLKTNLIVYFHNLKFDGAFILSYLLCDRKFKQAITVESPTLKEWNKDKEMENNSFRYSISMMGQWYTIIVKVHDYFIEFRDSLKLLPFSVKKIGKSFGTKHHKLDMQYKGLRYPGCKITEDEKAYIANDVFVVKEALEIMFDEGHKKLTIGSCCLSEYQSLISIQMYRDLYPDLYEMDIDENLYGKPTAGDYIHKSYRGGWCYLAKGKEGKVYKAGVTADVNSLYPSMMSSESGNYYPVGEPTFWSGNYIPIEAIPEQRYYFIRIRCRFYLKPGKLPFIQIKGSYLYRGTESLATSDIYDPETGRYSPWYVDYDGKTKLATVTMTMTQTDFKLFQEHYDLYDFEILDGCWFNARKGIFDKYIEKYKKIKMESTGAIRELAKLFLNNLYGKMASSTDSSFKVAFVKPDGSLGFELIRENNKKPGYIAVGSAITSYARNFTIRAAQKNYHGVDKPGFIYADTDSIHCELPLKEDGTPVPPEEFLVDVPVHPTDFCHWKLESCWDEGIFSRQKTYIEHITEENRKPIKIPYYNVKCAGMPERCKNLFVMSMSGVYPSDDEIDDYEREEIEWLDNHKGVKAMTLADFKVGLKVPGKLMPKRIPGGVLLVSTEYTMHDINF